MSIAVSCAGCGKAYKVDDAFAGKKAKCKGCGGVMVVPGVAAKAAAVSAKAGAGAGAVGAAPGAAGPGTRRSTLGKPVGRVEKPKEAEPGEFDFSSLDDIENTGTIDYSVQPMPVPRAEEKVARLAYTAAPAHLRAAAAGGKVGVRAATKAAGGNFSYGATTATGDFWSWETLKPGVGGYIAIGLVVIGALCLVNETASSVAAIVLGLVGLGYCLYGVLKPLHMAREEGFGTYLMYRFVPLYAAFFVITRWHEAKDAVFAWIKGAAMVVLALLLFARGGAASANMLRGVASRAGGGGRTPMAVSDPFENDGLTPRERQAKRLQHDRDSVPITETEASTLPVMTQFPELGEKQERQGVNFYSIHLEGEFRGSNITMMLLVPMAEHAEHSLPCVVMSSHTGLLEGYTMNDDDVDAAVAITKTGVAVIMYDASMFYPTRRPQSMLTIISEYVTNEGGVSCARNALNFVVARVPMVDPARVYAAGIGASGRLALSFALAEPRVRGVAVIEPICDVKRHVGNTAKVEADTQVGGIGKFVTAISPIEHVAEFKVPVYVVTRGAGATAANLDSLGEADVSGTGSAAAPNEDEATTFVNALKAAGQKPVVEKYTPVPQTNDTEAMCGLIGRWVKKASAKPVFSE